MSLDVNVNSNFYKAGIQGRYTYSPEYEYKMICKDGKIEIAKTPITYYECNYENIGIVYLCASGVDCEYWILNLDGLAKHVRSSHLGGVS